MAHVGEEFGFGAIRRLGLEQSLRSFGESVTDCLLHGPEYPQGNPGQHGEQSHARPGKQPAGFSFGSAALCFKRVTGARQHGLGKEVVLVADLAIGRCLDRLRAGEYAEIADDVASGPERISVDRCRLQSALARCRQARPQRCDAIVEISDRRVEPLDMAECRARQFAARIDAPVAHRLSGEGVGLAQVTHQSGEIRCNAVDLVAERVGAVHRDKDGAACDGQNEQARQIADPYGTDKGKLPGQAHYPETFARKE